MLNPEILGPENLAGCVIAGNNLPSDGIQNAALQGLPGHVVPSHLILTPVCALPQASAAPAKRVQVTCEQTRRSLVISITLRYIPKKKSLRTAMEHRCVTRPT